MTHSKQMSDESPCANCDGEGWVCEDHPEVPWANGKGCCGGAGMPCVCNQTYPPRCFGEAEIIKEIGPINVVRLKPKCNSDALKMLEGAMSRVKSGDISSIALSWVKSDGAIGGDISSGADTFAMLAALTHVQRYFEKQTFDGDDYV